MQAAALTSIAGLMDDTASTRSSTVRGADGEEDEEDEGDDDDGTLSTTSRWSRTAELDAADFDVTSWVDGVLERQTLGELLRTYNAVLGDMRALDAERKALVYDNYSKLIRATEMIGQMRGRMGGMGPVVGTLDGVVGGVLGRVEEVRAEVRGRAGNQKSDREKILRVLETPEQIRIMVAEGKEAEAKARWESVRRVLLRWKERGVGGQDDVQDCLDDGDAALRGEAAGPTSWVHQRPTVSSPS